MNVSFFIPYEALSSHKGVVYCYRLEVAYCLIESIILNQKEARILTIKTPAEIDPITFEFPLRVNISSCQPVLS